MDNAVEYVSPHVVAPLDGGCVRLCGVVCVCDHVEEHVGAAFCSSRLVDVVTSLGRPAMGLGCIGGASVIGEVSIFVVRVCLLSCGR